MLRTRGAVPVACPIGRGTTVNSGHDGVRLTARAEASHQVRDVIELEDLPDFQAWVKR